MRAQRNQTLEGDKQSVLVTGAGGLLASQLVERVRRFVLLSDTTHATFQRFDWFEGQERAAQDHAWRYPGLAHGSQCCQRDGHDLSSSSPSGAFHTPIRRSTK